MMFWSRWQRQNCGASVEFGLCQEHKQFIWNNVKQGQNQSTEADVLVGENVVIEQMEILFW